MTVCLGLVSVAVEVREGVTTDQQNENIYVPTTIAHRLGGVRLGFEGLLALMTDVHRGI